MTSTGNTDISAVTPPYYTGARSDRTDLSLAKISSAPKVAQFSCFAAA